MVLFIIVVVEVVFCSVEKLQFVDNTKLCGVADTPEGRDAIQRNFDRPKRWARGNLRNFNKVKCKVLHLGWEISSRRTDWAMSALKASLWRRT